MTELVVPRRVIRPRWLKVRLRQPLAVAGAVIALAWIVIAVFAPLIAPYGSLAQTFTPAQSPSLHHLFGTDELGRDVLSRVIYGSRVSIPIALLLVVLASSIGCVVGAIGYGGAVYGYEQRDVVSPTGIPLWTVFLALPLGAALSAVHVVVEVVALLRGAEAPDPFPAVPDEAAPTSGGVG